MENHLQSLRLDGSVNLSLPVKSILDTIHYSMYTCVYVCPSNGRVSRTYPAPSCVQFSSDTISATMCYHDPNLYHPCVKLAILAGGLNPFFPKQNVGPKSWIISISPRIYISPLHSHSWWQPEIPKTTSWDIYLLKKNIVNNGMISTTIYQLVIAPDFWTINCIIHIPLATSTSSAQGAHSSKMPTNLGCHRKIQHFSWCHGSRRDPMLLVIWTYIKKTHKNQPQMWANISYLHGSVMGDEVKDFRDIYHLHFFEKSARLETHIYFLH